jgi:hypothetical protein
MSDAFMRSVLTLTVAMGCIAHAFAADNRPWKMGKVTRADQSKRIKPEIEVWHPSLTHWYTFETNSAIVKATETVPAGVKRRGSVADLDRDPPMAFRVGETVKFAVGEPPPDPKTLRELFVIDRKGKEHILTIDGIMQKAEK